MGDISQLLKEWKLENILPHLLAEKIDAEILEMMKLQHIRLLLCNFPLGVQIRFEHNLEQWRYNIGKPLHAHKCCQDTNDFMCNKQSYDKVLPRTYSENTTYIPSQPQPQIDTTTANIAIPHESAETTNNLITIPVSNITPPETPASNRSLASSSGPPTRSSRWQASAASKDIPNSMPPYSAKPYAPVPKVNLREILMKSKPEGPHFMKIYSVRKTFLKPERRRLVNVIVTYYLRNELRFDLQTSYVLEAAILKMFPNERLEMYRKSKRGSLYCRYMNAKKIFINLKNINVSSVPDDNDDAIENGDMATIAGGDASVGPRVTNAANENEDVNIDEPEEFSYCLEDGIKGELIKPKIEVDSEYGYT